MEARFTKRYAKSRTPRLRRDQPAVKRMHAREVRETEVHEGGRGELGRVWTFERSEEAAVPRQRSTGEVGGHSGRCLLIAFTADDVAVGAQVVHDRGKGRATLVFEQALSIAGQRFFLKLDHTAGEREASGAKAQIKA